MIAGLRRGKYTSSPFCEYKLLKNYQIRILQIGEFIYCFEHDLLPLILKDYFTTGSDVDLHAHYIRNSTAYCPANGNARTNSRQFNLK